MHSSTAPEAKPSKKRRETRCVWEDNSGWKTKGVRPRLLATTSPALITRCVVGHILGSSHGASGHELRQRDQFLQVLLVTGGWQRSTSTPPRRRVSIALSRTGRSASNCTRSRLPTVRFDTLLRHYVLNVLLPEEQALVLMAVAELLAPDGIAYYTVRRDIASAGFRAHTEHAGVKVYQRNVVLPFASVLTAEHCEIYACRHDYFALPEKVRTACWRVVERVCGWAHRGQIRVYRSCGQRTRIFVSSAMITAPASSSRA